MRMKFLNNCLLCLLALLASCSAPKEVLYLQDITSLKEEVIDKNYEVSDRCSNFCTAAFIRLFS